MPEYTVKTDVPSKLNYPIPTEGQKTYNLTFDEDGISLKESNSFNSFYSVIVKAKDKITLFPDTEGEVEWENLKSLGNWEEGETPPISIDENDSKKIKLEPGFIYQVDVQMHTKLNAGVVSTFEYAIHDVELNQAIPVSSIGIATSVTPSSEGSESSTDVHSPILATGIIEVKDTPKEIDIKWILLTTSTPDPDKWAYTNASFMTIKTLRAV